MFFTRFSILAGRRPYTAMASFPSGLHTGRAAFTSVGAPSGALARHCTAKKNAQKEPSAFNSPTQACGRLDHCDSATLTLDTRVLRHPIRKKLQSRTRGKQRGLRRPALWPEPTALLTQSRWIHREPSKRSPRDARNITRLQVYQLLPASQRSSSTVRA
jgi:hypothetical protein